MILELLNAITDTKLILMLKGSYYEFALISVLI